MQCTPESHLFFNGHKDQAQFFDSGYSSLFYTPQSITRDTSLSLSEETPKENRQIHATPKDKKGYLSKDSKAAVWCETPKLYKKDASLQYRLAVCKSILDVKANASKSPCKNPLSASGQWLSTSLDSIDSVIGTLATSTLSQDQELSLSGRKRRLLYSQVRTSTLDDGKPNSEQLSNFDGRVSLSDSGFNENCSFSDKPSTETPHRKSFPNLFNKNHHSPICYGSNNLCDGSILCSPSGLQTPKNSRLVCEDGTFISLTLDGSQDTSLAHDASFQELHFSASKGNNVASHLMDTKRRPRLQRQNRLSTLKEGGSHSDDDHTCGNNRGQNLLKEDEVFSVAATPQSGLALKSGNSVSADGVASIKRDFTTPLRRSSSKGDGKTPLNSRSSISDSTPLRNTPLNLSLTPALELVHVMCMQKAQTFNGQSPSLKDELQSTVALVQTPATFRTSMPLAGLIGRKMGVGTLDILTELNKRNLKHILSCILGYLTPECIYRCGNVCKSWKGIIRQDRRASFKRRSHLSELNNSVEDVVSHVPEADTRTTLLNRSALKMVQSQSRSFCTPQSGSRSLTPLHNSTLHSGSSSKREKFLEVAKTLFSDECLKPCPRCQHPARCHSVRGEGVCSSTVCGFRFCLSCLCAFHGSKECGSQSVNRRKKDVLIPGSAQSKRNVRRL